MANYVGIEIAPDAVRGVLIKTALRKSQLAGMAEVPILAATVPVEGEPEPEAPIQGAVKELLGRLGVTGYTLITALDGTEASVRRVELPIAAMKKIDELLPYEMEALVPFDVDETVLEYQPIDIEGRTAEHAGKARLLVFAVQKERIRGTIAQLEHAGLDPQELAIGAAALDGLGTSIPMLAGEGPICLVHLSAHRVEVCVLGRGRCEFARTIGVGQNDLGRAEAAYGVRPANAAAQRLSRELRQTVSAWRMQGGAPFAQLVLSGAGLEDSTMVEWLGEALGHAPTLLEIPESLPPSGLSPIARARFGFAYALAARGGSRVKRVNLRHGEFASSRTAGFFRENVGFVAAASAAVFCAIVFSFYARYSVLQTRRETLEAELERVSAARLGEQTRSVTRARALLEGAGGPPDPLPRFTAFDALAAISSAIPEDVDHNVQRLHIDLGDDRSGGHFELTGTVSSIEERDRISQALGHVTCFQELELGPLTDAPNQKRSYRMEANILCPGAAPPNARGRGRGRAGGSGAARGGAQ